MFGHITYWAVERMTAYLADELKLEMKGNWQVFPTATRGVDFVGYRFFRSFTLLRKKTCKRFKTAMIAIRRKWERGNRINYRQWCTINSYKGWLKWCDSFRLAAKYLPLVILAIEDENEKAFMTWLYLQYRRLIYSEVRKIVGNTDEAEDLLQSVVEKLIEKLPLLRAMEQSKLVNYIISTAKNTAYNSLRGKEQEILWEDQEELVDPAPMPEEHILAQEDLSRLARVWIDLDKKTQYLLSAKYILKKSGKEIASDLNMPPDNVRMALVRARRKARQVMEQNV